MDERDLDLLSAYIDGQLPDEERSSLEARLNVDSTLRRELELLRETTALIRSLPLLRAPRSFALTSAQVKRPTPPLLLSPWFSAISAAAAVFLLVAGVLQISLQASLQAVPSEMAFNQETEQMQQVAGAPTRPPATQAVSQGGQDTTAPPPPAANLALVTATPPEDFAGQRSPEAYAATVVPTLTPPLGVLAAPAAPEEQTTDSSVPAASELASGAAAADVAQPTETAYPTSAAPLPTSVASLGPAPTATLQPTASPTPTPEPAPVSAAPTPVSNIGIVLIGLALVLMLAAGVTTFLRRRSIR